MAVWTCLDAVQKPASNPAMSGPALGAGNVDGRRRSSMSQIRRTRRPHRWPTLRGPSSHGVGEEGLTESPRRELERAQARGPF